jgi:2,4-dienoyl-CoA reductase-like NADH-dependent reductase (Old Yellow Enzyme family)
MPHLFDPFKLRSVTLRNRVGVSPMCQYSCEAGCMSDWHVVHLGSRAVGGAALVMAEATAVEARGRISPNDSGLWTDDQIEPAARAAMAITENGAVPGMQLAHAGRKAGTGRPWGPFARQRVPLESGGWQAIGPSDVPFRASDPAPATMTLADIAVVQKAFIDAARRAIAAGYQVIELHSAHGYLSHSFLSPLSNKRTDRYGGSFENRIRFTVETAAALRDAMPQGMPLLTRISCSDWVEGGWTIEESVELSRRLGQIGVDMIDCSSGGSVPDAKIPMEPGYQVPFANAIRAGAGMPTAAVGLIEMARHAEEIVAAGKADMVFLGRAMLRDPYWALHAAMALQKRDAIRLPEPYEYVLR